MTGVYVVLGILLVLIVLASELGSGVPAIDRYFPDLAAETISVVLTLAFVHRMLTRQERARLLRASAPSLRSGANGLRIMTGVWADLVKGCLRPGDDPPRDLAALFPHYRTERLLELDRGNPRTEQALEQARDRLARGAGRLADAMGPGITAADVAYPELLDSLLHDPFLERFQELIEDTTDRREWRIRMQVMGGHREAFFERLLEAVAVHNGLAAQVGELRGRHSAPRHSLSGLALGHADDLRVDTTLEGDWWSSDPLPGSLAAPTRRGRSASG